MLEREWGGWGGTAVGIEGPGSAGVGLYEFCCCFDDWSNELAHLQRCLSWPAQSYPRNSEIQFALKVEP